MVIDIYLIPAAVNPGRTFRVPIFQSLPLRNSTQHVHATTMLESSRKGSAVRSRHRRPVSSGIYFAQYNPDDNGILSFLREARRLVVRRVLRLKGLRASPLEGHTAPLMRQARPLIEKGIETRKHRCQQKDCDEHHRAFKYRKMLTQCHHLRCLCHSNKRPLTAVRCLCFAVSRDSIHHRKQRWRA